jgi:hypothetical protein
MADDLGREAMAFIKGGIAKICIHSDIRSCPELLDNAVAAVDKRPNAPPTTVWVTSPKCEQCTAIQ